MNKSILKSLLFGTRYGSTLPPAKEHGSNTINGPISEFFYPFCAVHIYDVVYKPTGDIAFYVLIIKGEYTKIPADAYKHIPCILKFLIRDSHEIYNIYHLRTVGIDKPTLGYIRCVRTGDYSANVDFVRQ